MKTSMFSTSNNGYTLILGLGETGMAAAQWYLQQLLPIRVADTRVTTQAQVEALKQQYPVAALEVVLGPEAVDVSVLDGVQTLVISPGLAVTDPTIDALLHEAASRNIRVLSEVELFAQALHDLAQQGYQPKLCAVTGTNGKTTVVQMLKHMAVDAGYSVVAAGNISPAALTALMQSLQTDSLPDIWVIELSSFQLLHTYSLPVLAGVVLNLSQDHLDWHGSMSAYQQAKAQLFSMSEIAVVNRDDAATQQLALGHKQVCSFGLSPPVTLHDFGVEDYQGQEWISALLTTTTQYLFPTAALAVAGRHNVSNALAALTLATLLGVEPASLYSTLRSYTGEPHRCQFVRNVSGIDFINDSKGTNVGATVAAIDGLHRPLVLIVGGVAKGQDFAPLAAALTRNVCRGVVLIGRDAAYIAQSLQQVGVPLCTVSDLPQAVQKAFSLALAGDVVVLSPACASLDMFKNYIERGNQFIEAVTDLALDQGEVA